MGMRVALCAHLTLVSRGVQPASYCSQPLGAAPRAPPARAAPFLALLPQLLPTHPMRLPLLIPHAVPAGRRALAG